MRPVLLCSRLSILIFPNLLIINKEMKNANENTVKKIQQPQIGHLLGEETPE